MLVVNIAYGFDIFINKHYFLTLILYIMKTQNVTKTISKATQKARAKKQSVAIKLQRQLKQAHEKEIKGLNALVNYSTGKGKFAQFTEGKKATEAFIAYVNERDNVSIKLSDITVKSVASNLTTRELNKKDGTKKTIFSTFHVKLAISRIGKATRVARTLAKATA